eukprot:2818275-Amphidinium_carterae.1
MLVWVKQVVGELCALLGAFTAPTGTFNVPASTLSLSALSVTGTTSLGGQVDVSGNLIIASGHASCISSSLQHLGLICHVSSKLSAGNVLK